MINTRLEVHARNVNDTDRRLPKGRGRCFDIGSWGGCGVTCAAFADGECDEPQEIEAHEVIDEHGEELAVEIMGSYACFNNAIEVIER